MGFYGNLNSVNKSSFQFDKVYANRYEMDRSANSDGIFTGRYVLVDYDSTTSEPAVVVEGENSEYSISELIAVINNKNNLTSIPANFVPGYLEQHYDTFIPYSQRENWASHKTPEDRKTWINSTNKNGSLLIHTGFSENSPLWLIAPSNDDSGTVHGVYVPEGTFVAISGYLRATYYYSYHYELSQPVIDTTTGEYKRDENDQIIFETVTYGVESLEEYNNLDQEIKDIVIQDFVAEPELQKFPNDEHPFKYPKTIFATFRNTIIVPETNEETGEETNTPKDVIGYTLIANLDDQEFDNIKQFGIYRGNYLVDTIAYGHYGRGWDSTVWQKVYMDGKYSYRMIAELNSVVPTFDVTVDAPTQIPIPPYYDSDNSNVYYKLHVQPTWGMRVRAARPLASESTDSAVAYPSDVKDFYIKELTKNAREVATPEADRDLAIYFNKAGFNKYVNMEAAIQTDIISVKPTGIGYKNYYNNYEDKIKPDTYELSIMLPSIGQSISDMWDIVYGNGSEYYKGFNEDGAINNEVPGSADFNNRYLWDKKAGGFTDAPTRNTNVAWNSYNGLRPKTLDGTFDYTKLNNLAANINYAHDLFGMIIREVENFDDVDNWDPEKIYLVNNKFYYKGKKYTYTNIPSTDLTTALAEGYYKPAGTLTNVADGTYWKKELMITETYDKEEISNNNSVTQQSNTPYYNYIRIKEGEKVLDGTILGKARFTNNAEHIGLTTEGYIQSYYYKKRTELVNNKETPYYVLDTEASPSGDGQYYDIKSIRADNDGAVMFYIPDQYCYATKLLSDFGDLESEDSTTRAAAEAAYLDWNIKSTYTTDDFNEIHLCEGNYVFTSLLDRLATEKKAVRFFKIDEVEVHSYPASMEEDPTKPRMKTNITCPSDFMNYYHQDSENPNIWKVSYPVYDKPEDDPERKLLYTLEETLPENAVTLADGRPSTYEAYLYLAEQDNGNIFVGGHTIYEFIKDQSLTPVLIVDGRTNKLRQIYQTVNKGARTVVSLPEEGIKPIGLTGIEENEFYYCKGEVTVPDEARGIKASEFHREDVTDLDRTISGEHRFDQIVERLAKGDYYTLEIKGQPVFYVIGENYYYAEPDINNPDAFKKETVAKIKPAKSVDEYAEMGYPRIVTTEHPITAAQMAQKDADRLSIYYRLVEESDNSEGIEWVDFEGTPFIPYKYYVHQSDGMYTLADEYDPNETYYEKNDIYVNTSTNDSYAHGAIWNKTIDPTTAGVTLATRTEGWEAKEIKNFTEDDESMHGLILAINRLLLNDDRETRDTETVQGAINVMNDLMNRFNHLNVREFVTIDNYGRVHSADWDSSQLDFISNYGTGETVDDHISYPNRWIELVLNPNPNGPHFTIKHCSLSVPNTETISDKNTGAQVTLPNKAGWNNNTNDTLKLFTPIIDGQGHMVGQNEETVTLPYGFKTITTNGRVSNNNTQALAAQDNIVADNTQDTLGINSGNEWIKIETDATNDVITISHDAKNTTTTTNTVDLSTGTDGSTTFVIPVDTYDSTNHFISRVNTTYTLPNNYGVFEGDEGISSEASASHDTFSLTGDSWIQTTASKDNVAFAHIGPVTTAHVNVADETPAFGSKFTIVDWTFDSKGHKASSGSHDITIPKGSLTVSENVDGAKVLTSVSFTDTTGALVITNKNVGELPLTGYSTVSSLSAMPEATDSINTGISKLAYILNNDTTQINTRISDAINALDSSYTASGATADSNITSASTVNVISKIDVVNGLIANATSTSALVDAAGAAVAAKNEVIGQTSDLKTADTINGAKAFATDAATTAEQNAKDYVSTITFTYIPRVVNPDYDPDDPTSQQYIDGTPVTKTIGDWISYIMNNL